jgi:molybdate transport system ATP-binding protein
MSDDFLRLCQLACQTDHFCLGAMDLKVRRGEYVMITGPTGSGKTMLLEILAGLRKPSGGSVFYQGVNITDWLPEQRVLGFAYQDSLLYPFLTVGDNILFGAKMRGRGHEAALRKRALELAEAMGLTHLLERYPRLLSGGEKQRVSLARALLLQPSWLLLDEPLSSLDAQTKQNLRGLLRQLHQQGQVTVLHVTHDREDVDCLGTRLVELERGQLTHNSAISCPIFDKS